MSSPVHTSGDASPSRTLDVAEVFASLQGEGPLMGSPAVFLRLAGCIPPLCPHCDTPHALGPGQRMNVSTVINTMAYAWAGHTAVGPMDSRNAVNGGRRGDTPPLAVITGGEPFRQWTTGLQTLVTQLHETGWRIQYETSGKAGIPVDAQGMVVCSPKPMEHPLLPEEAVNRVHAFKFVVGDDIVPALQFVHDHNISPDKVWLMPLGAHRDEQLRRMPGVWEACARHGFRFSPRLHILTFGNRRGI